MFKIASILLLLIFLNGEVSMMKWKEKSSINWSDFQGTPNHNSPFDAQVYSGMQYSLSYSINSGQANVDFEVHSFFSPEKSWSKEAKQSEQLLRHEQLHFDISELYARKLRKALVEHEFGLNPEKEFEVIFNMMNDERKALQLEYDLETLHSKDKTAQETWNILVARELVNYADFD